MEFTPGGVVKDMNQVSPGSSVNELFSEGVYSVFGAIDDQGGALYPEEEACIAGAAPKRRREFAAGRNMARQALALAGVAPCPIPAGADRAPIWPPGVVGSISHTDDYCGVAVARHRGILGIGLDIESFEPLDAALWRIVVTDAERAWLERRGADQRGHLAKIVFCVKECFFKCQFSVLTRWLDFADVEVELDLQGGTFAGRARRGIGPLGPEGMGVAGRFCISAGRVFAAMIWPGPDDPVGLPSRMDKTPAAR